MSIYKISQSDYAEQVSDGIDENFQSVVGAELNSGTYYGEKISLKKFGLKRELMQTLPNATVHQSMAIYGDYCVLVHSNGTAQLFNLATNTKIANVTIPAIADVTTPHANVAQFGIEMASGNTAMPLLYISQWNGERGFLAFNLTSSGTISTVQTIMPNVDAEIFGAGQVDWIIDTDNGFLYSFGYKIVGGSTMDQESGGITYVCKFKMPTIADGASVTLTDNDVLDHFILPPFCLRQDMCYANGHVFIAAGGGHYSSYKDSWNKVYAVDLLGKCVSSVVDIYDYLQVEPEGLSLYDGKLIMTYNASDYGRLFSYEF